MEVTDTKYLAEIEKQQEQYAERQRKKKDRAIARGWWAWKISFKKHLEMRTKKNITTIEETKGIYGRAGNRVYITTGKEPILFRKFKNSTKAKKFIRK